MERSEALGGAANDDEVENPMTRRTPLEAALPSQDTEVAELRQALATAEAALAASAGLAGQADHRAKNLITLTASILHMQRMGIADPRAREVLIAAERRLTALSQIHDQLRTAADGPRVRLRAYLERFAAALSTPGEAPFVIEVAMDEAEWPVEVARPFLILATEAITNALVHGLGAGPGRITVALDRPDDSTSRLTVEDDGQGLPVGLKPGLGLQLIALLSEQLGGRHALAPRPGRGAILEVVIPSPKPD